MPSITADCLAILALACAALAFLMIRQRRSSHALFNGGVLLAIGLLIASALPLLSRLPWAEFADEASDQAIAALHLLEVTYVILTL
jgi:drug/metabolite transporter (DMT)-like permease